MLLGISVSVPLKGLPRNQSKIQSFSGYMLRPNDIYKFMILLPKDYYLFPDNGTENLLRPNFIYIKKLDLFFSCKMIHLKFVCVVLIIASAQVVQVIKVDI